MSLVRCPHAGCGHYVPINDPPLATSVDCPKCGQVLPSTSILPHLRFEASISATPVEATVDVPVSALDSPLTAAPPGLSARTPLPEGVRVGRFEVRQRLGEGAFGIVYRAYDPQLDREVALKVAKAAALASPQAVGRFLREARAAAQLRHPSIVPLFEAVGDGERSYIASAFIDGRTLADARLSQPPDLRASAQIVRRLAEALAYAHSRGVVHRDVKPANVMLDHKGEPLLTDFGLAIRDEGGERLTQEGSVLGTPAYMAPEQANGNAGPASDQYSLGVTLYELLTGQLPFRGETPMETLLKALGEEPPPPSRRNPRVPRDLETICLKCLAKRPAERYSDCQALADDLRRWLEDEPIRARRLAWRERAVRWCRRNPGVAGLTAAVAAALVLGTGVSTYFAVQSGMHEERAIEKAREALTSAENASKQETLARRHLYIARMQLAHSHFREARIAPMLDVLDAERPRSGREDLRGFEWGYLWRLCHSDLHTFRGHTAPVRGVAFRPDGKQLASASADGTVKLWDPATGREFLTLRHTKGVAGVAYSPDDRHIASAGADGTVKVWDTATGKEVLPPLAHPPLVYSVAYSGDGKRIASGGTGDVKVWDAATGKAVHSFRAHQSVVFSVAFSPDGKKLASGSMESAVKLWDADTGKELLALPAETRLIYSVAFSPDGKHLASSSEHAVRVWDTATGKLTMNLHGHGLPVTSVAFSPDGKRLASAPRDNTVAVWDVATGQQLFTLRGHTKEVWSVAFGPGGSRLATGGADHEVKLWDVTAGGPVSLSGHGHPIESLAFGPDGRRLLSGSDDNTFKVWEVGGGRMSLNVRAHAGHVWSAAFSPDGRRIATSGSDNKVKVWDASTGHEVLALEGVADQPRKLAFSPDGLRIAVSSFDGTVHVWNATTGRMERRLQAHTGRVYSVAFSPDGKQLASGGADKTVRVWDAATGRDIHTFQGHAREVYAVAYSPDGQRLASGSGDQEVKIWDTAAGQEPITLRGHTLDVTAVAFSPDGQRLVSGSRDSTVKVWDVLTGTEMLTLLGHTRDVNAVAFSPDGLRIASGGRDYVVKVWDATPVTPPPTGR